MVADTVNVDVCTALTGPAWSMKNNAPAIKLTTVFIKSIYRCCGN